MDTTQDQQKYNLLGSDMPDSFDTAGVGDVGTIQPHQSFSQPATSTQENPQSYQNETQQLPVQATQPTLETQEQNQNSQERQTDGAPIPSEERVYAGQNAYQKEDVLFEWKAPSRPFKKQSRQFYTTIGIIALLIGLILFFAGQIIPVAVVFAVVFLAYIMYSTPPGIVVHKLTTYGIRVEDTLYYWEELGSFWFTQKYGEPLLHIETDRFPNRLTLLLGAVKKEDMQYYLEAMLPHEAPPPTAYEKGAKWLQEKLPIDLES